MTDREIESEQITSSPAETRLFGQQLARRLKPGSCLSLIGPLGAGKTTLVQGIAEGLGFVGPVTSPTFILVREYATTPRLYHVDAYRVKDMSELSEIGFEEYLTAGGIVAIEWGDKITGLNQICWEICLEIVGEHQRRITLKKPLRQASD